MERYEKSVGSVTSTSVSEEGSSLRDGSSAEGFSVLRYDILTVFQAAPLAYMTRAGNLCPIGMLDFDLEREIVSEALNEARTVDAKIDVAFETATVDRLGAFLAKGESQILHFSCHGHPDYLFIENGWGAGQQLPVKELREWIAAGGSSLRFVFVSACHSRSAGEAFLEAGVPHVVCCQQDSQQVRNIAAVEFARAFYRALACNRSLQEAFELGRHAVRLCPHVEDAKNEMNKFVLLPEGGNHKVSVFFNNPLPSKFAAKSWCRPSRSRMCPVPPEPFVGRDVDMFRLIDAVRSSRIVRVTGERGTGKCSLVTSAVQYMYKRNLMDDMFWLPAETKRNGDGNDICDWLSRIFEQFQNDERRAMTFRYDQTYKTYRDEILDELHEKKALVVIDARRIVWTEGIKKLTTFLEDLFHGTRYAKVVVIHRIGDQIHSRNFSCVEADLELSPLSFESSLSLFSCLCRHVRKPQHLRSLFINQNAANPSALQHRSAEVLKILGNGNPARINSIAKSMSAADYEKLIGIARRPAPASFETRASLEEQLTQLQEELAEKVRTHDFVRAQVIQESLDEMEVLREALPDLVTLKMIADGIKADQDQAIFMKDFKTAAELQSELDSLNSQIKLEERDSPQQEPNEHEGTSEKCQLLLHSTRTYLDEEIRKLDVALEEACDRNDFRDARVIDGKLAHLKQRIEKLPSVKEMSTSLGQLKIELKEAKNDHKWEKAEILHHKISDLEKKLHLEREAEKELFGDDIEQGENADREATTDTGKPSEASETCSRDPPGRHADTDRSESPRAPATIPPRAMRAGAKDLLSRSNNNDNGASPGAYAIVGGNVERRRRPDGKFETEQSTTFADLSAPTYTDGTGFQEQEARALDQVSNVEGREVAQDGTAQSDEIQRCETSADLDSHVDTTSGPTETKPVALRGEGSHLKATGNDEHFLVHSSNENSQALPTGTAASRPGGEGMTFDINGRLLSSRQADKYCKRHGFCRVCGQVQTHKRKRRGFRVKMEPLTLTDENNDYVVYKGCHIADTCYTLEQAARFEQQDESPNAGMSRRGSSGSSHSRSGASKPAAVRYDAALKPSRPSKAVAPIQAEIAPVDALPVASVVPATASRADGENDKTIKVQTLKRADEEDERAKIERLVRETLSGMTVAAASVETIKSVEETTKKGDHEDDSKDATNPKSSKK